MILALNFCCPVCIFGCFAFPVDQGNDCLYSSRNILMCTGNAWNVRLSESRVFQTQVSIFCSYSHVKWVSELLFSTVKGENLSLQAHNAANDQAFRF
jgi:hypothetical protein